MDAVILRRRINMTVRVSRLQRVDNIESALGPMNIVTSTMRFHCALWEINQVATSFCSFRSCEPKYVQQTLNTIDSEE